MTEAGENRKLKNYHFDYGCENRFPLRSENCSAMCYIGRVGLSFHNHPCCGTHCDGHCTVSSICSNEPIDALGCGAHTGVIEQSHTAFRAYRSNRVLEVGTCDRALESD